MILAITVRVALGIMLPLAVWAQDSEWNYLINKLAADGVSRAYAREVLYDPRVPPFTELEFQLEPRESSAMYRGFRTGRSVAEARACRARYGHEFRSAERRSGVPANVLCAILYVETQCGRNTGTHMIMYRLARLAMASEPTNLERNVRRHTADVSPNAAAAVTRRVQARASALHAMFYPEVLATFQLSERLGIDPLDIRGSPSGAFGLPQFLPSSYLRFAVDGNDDGRVSLYDPADAIASAANFLRSHGWRGKMTAAGKRDAIWAYNHSKAYVDTILFLAERIGRTYPPQMQRATEGSDGHTGRSKVSPPRSKPRSRGTQRGTRRQ